MNTKSIKNKLAISLAAVIAFSAMTGCTAEPVAESSVTPSSETVSSEIPSSKEISSEAPSSEEASSEAPSSKVAESSKTPASSKAPVSSAVSKAKSGKLTAVYDAVIAGMFGEDAPSFMKNEDTAQLKELTGVDFTDASVKEFIYAAPMMNVQFQYLVGIEANDGKAADAEKILTDYKDKILAEKEAFPYVDFGLEKARGAKVITVDNYVFYVCIANPAREEGKEITQEAIDAEIAKAVKIIKETLKK